MRLTLRTLLAWLDDTLPPSQVREIGKQVSSSPFARELVERIHRVTRQRRYTVPGKTGPDATDPNIVAGYVDNDLGPEQVAEYEKKCLTSDVNLAEVAAVHQILSLLGQKVQVPAEVKSRMYLLVKGRESIPPPLANGTAERPREPVTRPIQPWVAPEPPRRHWAERFGPIAACLGLIALLSWSAYQSLGPAQEPSGDVGSPAVATRSAPVAKKAETSPPPAPEDTGPPNPLEGTEKSASSATPGPDAGRAGEAASKEADARAAETAAGGPRPADAKAADAKAAETAAKPRAVPAGALGVVDGARGVLLRFDNEKQSWEKLADGNPLAAGDRLLCLAPFRARLVIGRVPVTLVGETAIRLTGKAPDDPPSFELADGRVLVEPAAAPATVRVEYAGHAATVERASPGAIGLERMSQWVFGKPADAPAPLAIFAAEGDVSAAMGTAKEALSGPGRIVADASGSFRSSADRTVPDWMTGADAASRDPKPGQQFLAKFAPDRPVIADIVVLIDDDSPAIRNYAIQGIKAMGDLSYLMPILRRPNDPSSRASTAAALRSYLGLGPQAVRRVQQGLDEDLGPEDGRVVRKLLAGYSAEEAAQPETLRRLVDLLSPKVESLVVRELALENLRTITGRDALGYDPEMPDEKGYNAWKNLASKGELKPAAKRKSA
ncbi:hypothetical protein OJF2_64840 [Aquisphaera giovannonii]|uniref:Uncharacterized protein n=1 Tax=Aquisphaera giovannonii TaxID=406548 RepID=A0A5B9WBF2_9BACT|nr:hypothetical protein [Aquisphaera giovannonii]QEH37892.1 hypothetical protein OJF2_64840 [Aquisphaera giovannonii]